MRMIILSVLCAVVAMASPAYADTDCTKAMQGVVEMQNEHDRWYPAAVNEVQGGEDVDFDFSDFVQCRKMLPVARKRLWYVEEILGRDETAHHVCNDDDDGEPAVSGFTATELRAILKEYIAVCDDHAEEE